MEEGARNEISKGLWLVESTVFRTILDGGIDFPRFVPGWDSEVVVFRGGHSSETPLHRHLRFKNVRLFFFSLWFFHSISAFRCNV